MMADNKWVTKCQADGTERAAIDHQAPKVCKILIPGGRQLQGDRRVIRVGPILASWTGTDTNG